MSLSVGIVAAIVAGLGWAALDVLRKQLAASLSPTVQAALLLLGQAPLFVVWALWAEAPLPAQGYWAPGLVLVGITVAAQVLFAAALQAGALSLTIPMLSFTPALSAIFAWAWLGEVPSLKQRVGVGLIVVGALILHGGPDAWRAPWRLLLGPLRDRGARLMLIVAALWSLTITFDKHCLEFAERPAHAAIQSLVAASSLLVVLAVRRDLGALRGVRGVWGTWLAAVLALALAVAMQLLALQTVLVSLVEGVKRSFGLISSVILGKVIFGEAVTLNKLLGVGLMAFGLSRLL